MRFLLSLLALSLIVGCGQPEAPEPEPEPVESPPMMEQSPIDLADAASREFAEMAFDYAAAPVSVVSDHGFRFDLENPGGVTVDGRRYELLQFHFHHPSEHTVSGAAFPMEMHLVHQHADGALAVVGVFLAEGDAHEALASVWGGMEEPPGEVAATLDPAALLPEERTTWRYPGSLTTPPYTEGVSWFVMTEPVTVSREQIEAFQRGTPMNARPVQPLNARELTSDQSP